MKHIFAQLVDAVAYIHSKSCVHRDQKLENTLLDKHENVKSCGFGPTRKYERKAGYRQTYCATTCYSAPEMLNGSSRAEIGIIVYALLATNQPAAVQTAGPYSIQLLVYLLS